MTVTRETPFVPEDDCYHQLGEDNPHNLETNWWAINIPERRMGIWVHSAYYQNRDTVTWRIFAWDDRCLEDKRLPYYKRMEHIPMPKNPDMRDIIYPEGGYSLKMLKPLMDYHVGYTDKEANFGLDFEFKGIKAPRRFIPGEAPAMHNPHLDHLGHFTGELTLRGERIPIDCYSVRDRTWGPREGAHSSSQKEKYLRKEVHVKHPGGPKWREVERERGNGRIQYIFGHTDENTGFLSFVRPSDGDAKGWSPMNMGWLLKDGEFEFLDKSKSRMKNFRNPNNGLSEHMLVEMVDDRGRSMEAEGFAVSHMSEAGHGSNALMRWEYDGKIGWGEDQDRWKDDHYMKLLRALRQTRL